MLSTVHSLSVERRPEAGGGVRTRSRGTSKEMPKKFVVETKGVRKFSEVVERVVRRGKTGGRTSRVIWLLEMRTVEAPEVYIFESLISGLYLRVSVSKKLI